jgi:FkbM family methyltransferase
MKKANHKNITLVNKGVWNYDGQKSFNSEGADGGGIVEDQIQINQSKKITEIQTTSLRHYLNREVDFLKIDIEGAEVVVLADCEDLLANVKLIFVEYHSSVGEPQQLKTILEILVKNNFRYFIQSTTIDNHSLLLKEKP